MTVDEFHIYVCQRIKELRKEKGLTQFDLATEIGIDDANLRKIESGKTNPTIKTIYRIAQALQVNVQDLLP
jgi:transcriptional regulator with XRE-family HTH domain